MNSAVEAADVAIEFRRFSLVFRGTARTRAILTDVDVRVPQGGFYLLVGESGSGKSTLLRLITGLWEDREPGPVVRGELRVLGHNVVGASYPRELRGRVQAVLQDEGLLDELSPRGNVELALRIARRSTRLAPALLAQAGLPSPPTRTADLSGGMRKRVAVARALAGEPELLVFDEPTAGLDVTSAREVAELLAATHERAERRTTLVITHDLAAFRGLAHRAFILDPTTSGLLDIEDDELGDSVPRAAVTAPEGASAVATTEPPGSPPFVGLRRLLLSSSALSSTLGLAFWRLPPVYLGIVVATTVRFVIESVLFVVLGCATIGGLATFFSLRNNPLEGAFTGAVLTGAGKVLIAVLVPLLAGFFFTARIAAGAAARLGTMKRTSQVAALQLLGIRPSDYLLTPLIWASSIALPVVTAAGIVAACLASLWAARLVLGVSDFSWAQAFFAGVENSDLRFGLWKSTGSGFLVALLTYFLAMGPKRSGRDVGESVNRSIVVGVSVILVVHGVLTLIQFG